MVVKIYFVRHGHSVGNENNLITGHFDCALSNTGKTQAELVSKYIAEEIKPDIIFSSSLTRAVETVRIASEKLKLPIIKEDAFKELSAGEWEGVPFEEALKQNSKEFVAWLNGEGTPSGGEKWEDVLERATKRLKELVLENEGKKVVICTHGGVIKALICYFSGMDLKKINDIDWVSNASVTEVWYKDGNFEIKGTSYDKHLGQLTTSLPKTI